MADNGRDAVFGKWLVQSSKNMKRGASGLHDGKRCDTLPPIRPYSSTVNLDDAPIKKHKMQGKDERHGGRNRRCGG